MGASKEAPTVRGRGSFSDGFVSVDPFTHDFKPLAKKQGYPKVIFDDFRDGLFLWAGCGGKRGNRKRCGSMIGRCGGAWR